MYRRRKFRVAIRHYVILRLSSAIQWLLCLLTEFPTSHLAPGMWWWMMMFYRRRPTRGGNGKSERQHPHALQLRLLDCYCTAVIRMIEKSRGIFKKKIFFVSRRTVDNVANGWTHFRLECTGRDKRTGRWNVIWWQSDFFLIMGVYPLKGRSDVLP